jgi:thiamine transport system substrate-binding protein
MKRTLLSIVLLALTATSLSACAGGSAKDVTLVAHDSFVMSKTLIADFEKSSGYKLHIIRAGDVGALTNKLVLTKTDPIGDAVYGIDNTFASVATDNQIVDGAFVPIDFADVCLNYDVKWFASHGIAAPTSWRDVVKPAYRGLTVIENPNTSSTGLAFLAATYGGFKDKPGQVIPGASAWWLSLRNNKVKVDAGWEEAYYTDFSGSSGQGNYPIVLSYSSSPADEIATDGTTRTRALLDGCYRQTEYFGVLNGASNKPGALALEKFFLTHEFQTELPSAMYVYPIDSTVALPAAWQRFAPKATTLLGGELNVSKLRQKWLTYYNFTFDGN